MRQQNSPPPASDEYDFIVIGGGFSGLLAAYRAIRGGLRPLLLESGNQVGGAVAAQTLHLPEGKTIEVDAGAESFATRSVELPNLLEELGIYTDMIFPLTKPGWLVTQDEEMELSDTSYLGIPGTLKSADIRRRLGQTGLQRARLDDLLPASIAADSRTLGELVRKRMGAAVVEKLVNPVTLGVHSVLADDLKLSTVSPSLLPLLQQEKSLRKAVNQLRANAPAGAHVASLRGGLFRLTREMARDIETVGHIRTGQKVVQLSKQGRRWRIQTQDHEFEVNNVVLATPEAVTARLLGYSGELGSPARVILVTALVHAPDLAGAPRGTGAIVSPEATRVQAKALTHVNAKWPWIDAELPPDHHILRLTYGRQGAANPVAKVSDQTKLETALADIRQIFGLSETAQLDAVDFNVTPWSQEVSSHKRNRDLIMHAYHAGVPVTGAWVHGTGLANLAGG